MNTAACLLTSLLLTATLHAASHWPRFLGPQGNATVADADVPLTWTADDNIQWRTALPGPGTSSPIVWEDKVFLTCWTGYGDSASATDLTQLVRHLVCASLTDGNILWIADVPARQPEDPYQGFITEHGYASNTPVTDGERVYVFFGKSGALAFDMNGSQLWQTHLGQQSSSKRWGSAGSPVLVNGKLIVNASDEGRAIVALDTATGSILWQAEGDQLDSAYGTPLPVEHNGTTDLVLGVPHEIWGLNPDTGKLRWFAQHNLPGNLSPSVVRGGDTLFMFGGYPTTGSAALKIGGKGDLTPSGFLWKSNVSTYVPTPVYHDGHLYVINDQGFALCINANTGEEVYRERAITDGPRGRGKPFYASPVLIRDRIFCVSRQSGTFVIPATPRYQELARNVITDDDSQFNATPAVTGNRLLLRSDKFLYSIGN